MQSEKTYEPGFGATLVCVAMLILAALVGAFNAAEIFVTEYSVLAGRLPYHVAR
jgi:hypothetical protein